MTRPPRRLLDDPSVAARLRQDLANARAHSSAYDLHTGLQTLTVALDGPEPGGVSDGGVEAHGSAREQNTDGIAASSQGAEWSENLRAIAGRWWGWTAAGLATVAAVWGLQRERPVQSAPRGAPEPASIDVEGVGTTSTYAGITPEPTLVARPDVRRASGLQRARVAPVRVAARASGPRAKSTASRPAADLSQSESATPPEALASAARATEASPPEAARDPAQIRAADTPGTNEHQVRLEEVEHLARLRRLLQVAPQRALTAAREGQRIFAGGVFAEERAGLIVFALARLGHKDEVLREGRQFLRAYPGGPFAARVREIVRRQEGRDP